VIRITTVATTACGFLGLGTDSLTIKRPDDSFRTPVNDVGMETISGGRNSMVTAVNSINRLITIEVIGLDMTGVSYCLSRSVSFFCFVFFV
jgi:hypothetical protein